jgi:small GTP-binding protein
VIQKKICMVGVHATGKTSLVQRYVSSIFSEKYHSTVGVKIDRKDVRADGSTVKLVLWDLEGRDGVQDIQTSYLRGAAGIFFVADGTRRDTFDQIFEIRQIVEDAIGPVPSILALNKYDLKDEWKLADDDSQRLKDMSWDYFRTSAKSGRGVEGAFEWLALATLGDSKK